MVVHELNERTHRLPCFTLSTDATEHLKQAAKVRGLGVERQLKPGDRRANNCRRSIK
ncbi:hypothetical protein EMIT0P44_400033 [Pseudomonas sp. IT-P44]